jgi:pimeloyl-ACP methyl ester carboxylesterase
MYVHSYSISNAVDDLEMLLKKLNVRRFHLYGQSYGGMLAFEYCKRVAERKGENNNNEDEYRCLSVILSSTPTSVSFVESEVHRLLDDLQTDHEGNTLSNEEQEQMTEEDTKALWERFRLQHQVQTPEMPLPLVDAYAHAGTIWRGTAAIPDYVASPPSEHAARLPSAMILRGQHDFVTAACTQDWGSAFHHPFVRQVVLAGCAHHGLLEQPRLYGDTVDSFFSEYD